MTFGLALILINGSRFFWLLRVATFAVFAVLFWYVIDQGFIHRHPLSLDNPGAPSFFNALRGFLFFGLPCLLLHVVGKRLGQVGYSRSSRSHQN